MKTSLRKMSEERLSRLKTKKAERRRKAAVVEVAKKND